MHLQKCLMCLLYVMKMLAPSKFKVRRGGMLAGTVGKPIIVGQTASQEFQLVVKRC